MLLYLTSNARSGLLDTALQTNNMMVKKLIGKFSLKSFVTKDMRNYATAQYFVVDISCVDEQLDDFIVVLQSFQMMFSARIVVILSDFDHSDAYIERLVSISITNIITADTIEGVTDELSQCFTDDGMQKYLPQLQDVEHEQDEAVLAPAKLHAIEIPKFKWNAHSIKIAVAGTQRRSGVTVTAFNLASWLTARGADVCYVEMNTTRHLNALIKLYGDQKEGEHYVINDIDCYSVNELDHDYNFIIYDCGEIAAPTAIFNNADIRFLCGGILPYEMVIYKKVLLACKGLLINKVTLSMPKEYLEYFKFSVAEDIVVAEPSFSLFDCNINGELYLPATQKYIEASKK